MGQERVTVAHLTPAMGQLLAQGKSGEMRPQVWPASAEKESAVSLT